MSKRWAGTYPCTWMAACGTHVFKALAMGAAAVAIGRPILYGLSLGGWQGVKSVFDTINYELQLAMKLAGCANIEEISRKFVT